MLHKRSLTTLAIGVLFSACSAATTGRELASTPCNPKLIAGILGSAEPLTASEAAYLKRCGVERHTR